MRILYVDGFRGFKSTFIPLKDVNFLVGENSTGKTSILSLIKLLSEQRFLITQEFDNGEVNLGFFRDIAGNGSKYFKIGLCNCNQNESEFSTILLKFINKEGLPVVSELYYKMDSYDIKINISKDKIKYKFKQSKQEFSIENQLQFFKEWIEGEHLSSVRFKSLDNSAASRPFGIIDLMILVNEELVKNNFNRTLLKKSVSFKPFWREFLTEPITWIAPIRAKPKRTYDSYKVNFSPEGDHVPYLLKNILSSKSKGGAKAEFLELIETFGIESGMFHDIEVKSLGRDKTSPFEINIILDNKPYKISNVGYGVSQVLPVIVELLEHKRKSWFAIQQPEVHLHPRAQAALGEFIFNTSEKYGQKFIIETHSDYTIDRFRLCIKNTANTSSISAQLLFFERTPDGNAVHQIDIGKYGEYSEDQPRAFREFFVREEINLLGL